MKRVFSTYEEGLITRVVQDIVAASATTTPTQRTVTINVSIDLSRHRLWHTVLERLKDHDWHGGALTYDHARTVTLTVHS